MSQITAPGIYDVPAADYHADRLVSAPTFSRSIAKLLVYRSPRHAWFAHPRLNPDYEADDLTKFDLGKASHALLLGSGERFAVIEAADWRTKAAKEAREQALSAGLLPILAPHWPQVQNMARAVRAQLEQHQEAVDAFTRGKPEQTMVWQEGGVWCRARLDWLPDGGRFFDDFKTTVNAAPGAWGDRVFFETGGDVQAALYRRGIRALGLHRDPVFRFVVAEVEPPHCLTVVQPTPAALDMADRKVQRALDLWRWCLEHNAWPGYPSRTCHVDPPPWHENRFLEMEARDETLRSMGRTPTEEMLLWQAPLDWTKETVDAL